MQVVVISDDVRTKATGLASETAMNKIQGYGLQGKGLLFYGLGIPKKLDISAATTMSSYIPHEEMQKPHDARLQAYAARDSNTRPQKSVTQTIYPSSC